MVYNSKLTLSAQHVGIPEEHKGKNPTPHPAPRFPRHRLPCISLSVNNPFNFALGKRALTLGEAGICTLGRCGGLWERVKCALRFTAFTRRFAFIPQAGEFSSESATFPVSLLSCLMAFWKPPSAHLALKTIPSNQKDQVSVHCSKMNAHPFAKRELLFCVPRRLMMFQYWFQLSINTFECTGFNLSA